MFRDTPNFRVYKDLENDLEENAKIFFQNIKKNYNFNFNKNKNQVEIIVPKEIYYILKKDIKNEREFLEKFSQDFLFFLILIL